MAPGPRLIIALPQPLAQRFRATPPKQAGRQGAGSTAATLGRPLGRQTAGSKRRRFAAMRRSNRAESAERAKPDDEARRSLGRKVAGLKAEREILDTAPSLRRQGPPAMIDVVEQRRGGRPIRGTQSCLMWSQPAPACEDGRNGGVERTDFALIYGAHPVPHDGAAEGLGRSARHRTPHAAGAAAAAQAS